MSHSVLIKTICAALLVCSSTAAAASTPSSHHGLERFGTSAPVASMSVYHRQARAAAPSPPGGKSRMPEDECNRTCKAVGPHMQCVVDGVDPKDFDPQTAQCNCQSGYEYALWMVNPTTYDFEKNAMLAPISCVRKGTVAKVAQCNKFCQANEAGAHSECGDPAKLSCKCKPGFQWSEPDSDAMTLCVKA